MRVIECLIKARKVCYWTFARRQATRGPTWKPIEQQPIGWHPNFNDGVRLNIRPFLTVLDVGKKGAGVQRDKPNIKWDKDRGKDVESAPWYHQFKGDRINDHHLTLTEKCTTWAKEAQT